MQTKIDKEGKTVFALHKEQIVEYDIYETEKYRVRVGRTAIDHFLNTKVNKKKKGKEVNTPQKKTELIDEFVQSKMHKLPKVTVTGKEFTECFEALKKEMFPNNA